MKDFFTSETILENARVRLEPLQEKHFEALWLAASNEELWKFTSIIIKTKEDFRKYFDTAIIDRQNKISYPFAVFDKQHNIYGGCSRFGNINFDHKRVEIGWTWYQPDLQRTGLNRNCKFLLLSWGFETLNLNRIELKTSHTNLRSQKAMEQIGAIKEGVHRNHMINPDGSLRDSVFYSFIKQDWPKIKASIFKDYA
jgi:RimJ/RimL family protein N-acetyltransferase